MLEGERLPGGRRQAEEIWEERWGLYQDDWTFGERHVEIWFLESFALYEYSRMSCHFKNNDLHSFSRLWNQTSVSFEYEMTGQWVLSGNR